MALYGRYKTARAKLPVADRTRWDCVLLIKTLWGVLLSLLPGFIVAKQAGGNSFAVVPIVLAFLVLGAVVGLLLGARSNMRTTEKSMI